MGYRAKKAYQDKITVESYNSKRFKSFKGKITNWLELRLIDKALRYLQVSPPAQILDVPCGTGRLTFHLIEKGYNVTAVDISSEMVSYMNKMAMTGGLSVDAEVGDAECLSFQDGSFDGSICLRLLGHTPPENRLKIIQELNRVCSDFLILAYYNKKSLKNILRKYRRKRKNIPWYPVDIFQIDWEIKKLGFKRYRVFYLAYGISETMFVVVRK